MIPQYTDPLVTLYLGDCLEVMAELPDESVDAVVTDPPAAISFMSKSWDHNRGGRTEWVAWMTEVMRECYRVVKPGGFAVVWSLPRTCHWTGWAIEDAGFRITDQLAHIFASGFPKGRTQLKPAREDWWLARKPGPTQHLQIDAARIGAADGHGGGAKASGGFVDGYEAGDGFTASIQGRWPSNVLLDSGSPELFDEPNPGVVGSGQIQQSHAGTMREDGVTGGFSGLSPRKAGTVLNHPDLVGGYSRFFIIPKADRTERERGLTEKRLSMPTNFGPKNQGALPQQTPVKPSMRGNHHPTVKPIDLMRHLVKLVTPPGGTVLDCFAGSGTTLLAASELGIKSIGIEREPEYMEIIKGRLMATPMGLGLSTELRGKKRTPGGHSVGNLGRTYERDGKGYGSITESRKPFDYGDQPRSPKADKPKVDSAPMFDEEPAA